MKKSSVLWGLVLAAALISCTPQATAELATPAAGADELPLTPCVLPTVIAPTPPAEMPGENEIDPATGLHVTGSPRRIDLASYRLQVTGQVDRPLALTYDDLRCMRRVETRATLVCPGTFVDFADWAGTPLRDVLRLAQVQSGASTVRLVGADGYAALVPLTTATAETSLLAYEWEDEPLPVLHGFPVRAVLPDVAGGNWVKWLIKIEVY
jgi:DMSO/TMAO reductase YedYZ molybdopterin-dependent catalytic subunit